MRSKRRRLAPLAALVLASLSCAVTPPAVPVARVEPVATPVAADVVTPDPAVERVLAHLLRYQQRSGLTRAELVQLADTVVVEARRHHFDPALVLAVMHVESRYNTYAVSPKNALGLMQLLPSTGEWLAPEAGVDWRGPQTLFDPIANVRLGVAYLHQLADRYGSIPTALVAYNWGPGRIDQFLRSGNPLPAEYAQLVLTAYGARDRSS